MSIVAVLYTILIYLLIAAVIGGFLFFIITTLIISKKPRNTGKLRDRDTEFTTDLLHSDRALTRCSFP